MYPISLGFFKRQMEPLLQANTPKTEAFVRFDKNYMGMLNGHDSSDLSQYLWVNLSQWNVFFVTAQDVQH